MWYSTDGGLWAQDSLLTGDYFAQNTDVVQPGEVAPFYERFGHSLNALDLDGDGEDDIMIMLGGFAPSPANDMWATTDGNNWVYCGHAPWTPRAWHGAVVFRGHLWIMGGTPLNNEVWELRNITKVPRPPPATRSLYNNYTYAMEWVQHRDAPWSPRVGMSLVSQFYFDPNRQTLAESRERMVLVGGYGGFTNIGVSAARYDGFSCRGDSWESYDGVTWNLLNSSNVFSDRAWASMAAYRGADPRIDFNANLSRPTPPRLFLFGGGFVGFTTSAKKIVNSMDAFSDAFWSEDGAVWHQLNYQEGGGTSTVPFYSSELWSATEVNSESSYLGLWGSTIVLFNTETRKRYPGSLILIAGDYDGSGDFSSNVYRSLPGLYCNDKGITCNGQGSCTDNGCVCETGTYGDKCQFGSPPSKSVAFALSRLSAALILSPLILMTYFLL